MIKLAINTLIIIITLIGLMSFAFLRNHLVATLLSLEFASLSVYIILFMAMAQTPDELFVALVYLTLAACEGALGLSILVAVIKHKGNDFVNASSLVQC